MGSTQSTWGVLTQRSPKMTRPLWTSLALLLLAALSHAEDYTCPSGKSKETITLAVGKSVDFSTQENDAYGKNVKCVVKFKRGKRSKCKLNFSCSAFTLTAKNSHCSLPFEQEKQGWIWSQMHSELHRHFCAGNNDNGSSGDNSSANHNRVGF